MINTIDANIRAFSEADDIRKNEQRSSEELLNLKKRLATIENQLKQDKPAGKRETWLLDKSSWLLAGRS